jgi:hypothetical protein
VIQHTGDDYLLAFERKASAVIAAGLARRCPLCYRVTFNVEDVRRRYCPCCGGRHLPRVCEHHPQPEAAYPE